MKKFSLLLLTLLMALILVGCSRVTESYAEKVNKAHKNDDNLTYAEVIEDLGEPAINLTAEDKLFNSGRTGWCRWYRGCESLEEALEKYQAGEKVYCLGINFLGDKAINATWGEYSPDAVDE